MDNVKTTQHIQIINYVEKYGSITPMKAFSELGITKLATRISEMRKRGYEVDTEMIVSLNRNGKKCRYTRYANIRKKEEAHNE